MDYEKVLQRKDLTPNQRLIIEMAAKKYAQKREIPNSNWKVNKNKTH